MPSPTATPCGRSSSPRPSTTLTPAGTAKTSTRSCTARRNSASTSAAASRPLAAGRPIASYGKACLVGTDGEYEHGNAFLTQVFADPVRDAVGGGKAWVPSTGKRAAPGASIDIPLAHKDALYVRSHYDTVTVSFTDAPAPGEVVAIFAFATRGRLHARLGGLAASAIEGNDGLR